MRGLLGALVAATAACGPSASSDPAETLTSSGVQLAPGRWEFTTTSMIAGMKAPKQRTTEKCIPADQTDPVEHLRSEQKCEITSRNEEGRSVRWQMTCPTIGHPWQAAGEITSQGTTADGHLDMTMDTGDRQFEMHLDWQARRIGDCS